MIDGANTCDGCRVEESPSKCKVYKYDSPTVAATTEIMGILRSGSSVNG